MSNSYHGYKVTKHICPRNCYGACGMLAYTENGILRKIEGDPDHGFTRGKICSKGYTYVQRIYHPDRIKYPLVQEERGSGKWKRISWDSAIEKIAHKIIELNKRYHSNLSLCLNKYSGNFGILHNCVENFFDGLDGVTRVKGSPCWSAGLDAQHYDFGNFATSDPSDFANGNLILLWGVNPAWTAVHTLPYIYAAQDKGAKVVVIDPIRTATAKKSDYYIQISPGGDGALALSLAKILIDKGHYDSHFISKFTLGWEEYVAYIKNIDLNEMSAACGVNIETINLLADLLIGSKPALIWVGFGMQRHLNGGQNIRAINALSALTGNIGIKGGGVQFAHQSTWVEQSTSLTDNNRYIDINNFSQQVEQLEDPPVKFLWISCRNLMTQEPQQRKLTEVLKDMELIVTVDHFMTPTAQHSDILLPTTTQFEEEDIVSSYWHHYIGYNEKAIEPYFESLSDFDILRRISKKLNELRPGFCPFTLNENPSAFFEKEFSKGLYNLLDIEHWSQLKGKTVKADLPPVAWKDYRFTTPSGKFEFYSEKAKNDGLPPIAVYHPGLTPSKEYPYWLITPHSQFGLNSQFQNLDVFQSKSSDPVAFIHPALGKKLELAPEDYVTIFNELGSVNLQIHYSEDVGPNIILYYQGWHPNSTISISSLIPGYPTDMGKRSTGSQGIAYYDTFVNIRS